MRTYVTVQTVFCVDTPDPGQGVGRALQVVNRIHRLNAELDKWDAGATVTELPECRWHHEDPTDYGAVSRGLQANLQILLKARVLPNKNVDGYLPEGWSERTLIQTEPWDWQGGPSDFLKPAGYFARELMDKANHLADGRAWSLVHLPHIEAIPATGSAVIRFAAWMDVCFGPRP